MDKTVDVDFVPTDFVRKSLGKTSEELLLQWGLSDALSVKSFKIMGSCPSAPSLDVHGFAKCFLSNTNVLRVLEINDVPPANLEVSTTPLQTSVRSMAFFDKLTEAGIVSATGSLRGCFEEIYHGFTVGDKLREMFVNEDSENASVFTREEQSELIFQLMKVFSVGGTMCQPDNEIERYLSMTQALYKELVTIYKASSNNEVKISTRAVQIHSAGGIDLFPGTDNAMNTMYLVIDPLKKVAHVIKYMIKPVW